jgi:hypothetical protein
MLVAAFVIITCCIFYGLRRESQSLVAASLVLATRLELGQGTRSLLIEGALALQICSE